MRMMENNLFYDWNYFENLEPQVNPFSREEEKRGRKGFLIIFSNRNRFLWFGVLKKRAKTV
jgi:hypothetical protein